MYESVHNKQYRNFYLISKRYNSLKNEVKEAKCVKKKQIFHYRQLKDYDILNTGDKEKLTASLSAEEAENLHYVTFDVFNSYVQCHT